MIQFHFVFDCGNSSVVEHDLAMVGVASSTLVSRSIFLLLFLFSSLFSVTIKESLTELLSQKYPNIQVEFLEIQTPKNLPNDIATYVLKEVMITSINGANGGAKAVFDNGGGITSINFKFEISAKMPVLIATSDIAKGTIINQENAQILLTPFENYDKTMLDSMPENKLAKNNIRANTPIKLNNIYAPKDVLKGSTLILEVRDGSVLIQSSAVATSDANIGDTIEVRQGSLRQKAKIISKNKAVIE